MSFGTSVLGICLVLGSWFLPQYIDKCIYECIIQYQSSLERLLGIIIAHFNYIATQRRI